MDRDTFIRLDRSKFTVNFSHAGLSVSISNRIEAIKEVFQVSKLEAIDLFEKMKCGKPIFDFDQDLINRMSRLSTKIFSYTYLFEELPASEATDEEVLTNSLYEEMNRRTVKFRYDSLPENEKLIIDQVEELVKDSSPAILGYLAKRFGYENYIDL